jgi:HAE1 family hydrophobic/amphiphilic exporter-1
VGIDRRDEASISQLYVRARPSAKGNVIGGGSRTPATVPTRIDNVVNFHRGKAAARIDRLDRQRMVAIRANVARLCPGNRIAALREAANEMVFRQF